MFAGTHLKNEQIRALLKNFTSKSTVEIAAEESCVSKTTSYRWRKRIINLLTIKEQKQVKAKGIIELDEIYHLNSFKGNHTKSRIGLTIVREPRKSDNVSHFRGISHEQVALVTGVEHNGRKFANYLSFGRPTGENMINSLSFAIQPSKSTMLLTDWLPVYKTYSRSVGVNIKQFNTKKHEGRSGDFHIQNVNSLQSQLSLFLKRFKGISSKNIVSYGNWFLWSQSTNKVHSLLKVKRLLKDLASTRFDPKVKISSTTIAILSRAKQLKLINLSTSNNQKV